MLQISSIPSHARKIAEFLAKPEGKEMSAGLEEIAQAVAIAVEDKALTECIYEKCMEKFDGDLGRKTPLMSKNCDENGKIVTKNSQCVVNSVKIAVLCFMTISSHFSYQSFLSY